MHLIHAINEFKAEVATPAWDWVAPEENTALKTKIAELAEAKLVEAYQITEKMARYDRIHEIAAEVNEALLAQDPEADTKEIHTIFHDLEKTVVRRSIIAGNPRIDSREKDMVRALDVRTGVLPRTHGSALFTRGETQALVTATLGTQRDAQIIDELTGERKD
ncbi:polyribonucleotide nucleotidyltransferase, partial [Vibrio parahaemolyticus AQ3810]